MIKLFRNIFFLTIPFLFISLSAKATHIVGGDFKITMVSNGTSSSTYDVQLRLYRDNVNGLVQLPNSVNVGIYQVGTNNLVTNKILNITNGNGDQNTNYKSPGKRLYVTYASEDKKSFFRYRDPETKEIITDYDDKGITTRQFYVPKKSPYFWHCVGSDCTRVSFGYLFNLPHDT